MAGRLETRDRLEQRARVRVLRSRAYLIDRPGFDHVAAVHHGDTLTGLGNDTEIVRHEQDCHVEITTALLDQLEDLRLVVTSSAVVGSSAIKSRGPAEIAMAIMTRWRMPPESSCGKAR